VGLIPIVRGTRIHAQRNRKVQGRMRRIGHHRGDQPERGLDLFGFGFEHELIVNLQQHLRRKLGGSQRRLDPDHRASDDVGGGSLQPRVDGGPFVEGA